MVIRRRFSRIRITRDTALFLVGLAGIVFVTIKGHPDPTLLVLFGGMVGLPAFLNNDEKRRDDPPPVERRRPPRRLPEDDDEEYSPEVR